MSRHQGMAASLLALFICCICCANAQVQWGNKGHTLTANIAQAFLTDKALSMVKSLVPESAGDLAEFASWADNVKSTYPWSSAYHFADTPDWKCDYERSRDCVQTGCVDTAIQNYTTRLANPSLSSEERGIALKFLVHFVGDIHCPMHVGFVSNKGGNSLKGTFMGKSTNLHSVWDGLILEKKLNDKFSGSMDEYAKYFVDKLKTGEWHDLIQKWESACPDVYGSCPQEWADQTVQVSCANGYTDENHDKIENNFNLGDGYYKFAIDPCEEQVAKAGIRMAFVLNRIFK